MVRCSVTQEADENCNALLGMELGKKYGRFTTLDILKYEHFTRKIKKTYSLLLCLSWFPAFSGVFTLAFAISTFRYPVRSHHG